MNKLKEVCLVFGTWLSLFFSACMHLPHESDRVQAAYAAKAAGLRSTLNAKGIDFDHLHLLLVACKAEKTLEVYLKNTADHVFIQKLSYAICAASGGPGPKRAQGDNQVPEGLYHIERFNPKSAFHLSLGINYPNASDKRLTRAEDPGNDIFIHGSCVSAGCLAMTDDQIQEIYLLALQARKSGQEQIPVYLFPFRMTDAKMAAALAQHPEHRLFWENLRQGYTRFDSTRQALPVEVAENGLYRFR